MEHSVEQALEAVPFCFGQISVRKSGKSFVLCHRDDDSRDDLETFRNAEDAIEIARNNDAGNYRPLKTAPDLRHGWRMELRTSNRSNGGCLRTILWKRDQRGAIASAKLPKQKFDPSNDQTRALSEPGSPTSATGTAPATVPLLCQEPCNLLVAACRKVVKGE